MTIIGWDSAIEAARDDVKDKLVALALTGIIYRSERGIWHQYVDVRTVEYGHYSPLPFVQGEILDELLDEGRLQMTVQMIAGLHLVRVT